MSLLWGQPKQPLVSEVEVADTKPEILDVSIDFTQVKLDDYAAVIMAANYTSVRLRWNEAAATSTNAADATRRAPAGEELVGPLGEFDRVGYQVDFCTPTGRRPNAIPVSWDPSFFDPPLQRPVTSDSMAVGALQTYEWAVRFPQMVKRMSSIAGAPQPSPWTRLWLSTVIEEPITSDPAWNNGFYADRLDVQSGLRRRLRARLLRSIHDLSGPNNLLTQARKACAADPAQGGDMAKALGRITAKVTNVAFSGDVMFSPQDNEVWARSIPGARYRE